MCRLRRELLPPLPRPRDPSDAAPVPVALPADDVLPREQLASAGAFLTLFAGVATLASVSLAGLRGHRWARPALLALSVAWSLTWIGTLLGATQYLESPRVGYWSIVVSIGVVIAGSITVWRSAGTSTREPQMTSV